jgi:DNA-binding HxlR family transcriptional regulator
MRYSEQLCPRYQRAIELLGKRWTGLILKVLLEGPLRFNEIAERLEVVSDRMLAERLRELETEGVIERRVYPEVPVRVVYRLTEKGQALAPVIEAIERWSERWVALEPAPIK